MKNYLTSVSGSIVLGALIIAISILMSGGIIRVRGLNDKTVSGTAPTAQAPAQPTEPQAPAEDNSPVQVSVDDDPVIGDKNAPITMIEFSDYECPFCKRHFDQTYGELLKNYINTGKLKLVFRDLPLPFHDPLATYQANAANCAREQGGDAVYYKFHDELFKRTTSNGKGMTNDQVIEIATDLGLNSANVKTCADSGKYTEEIKKDIADGNKVGANGTPTFFIGKSENGKEITATRLVGAQPYATFQSAIDALLK